jgi:hypothetical protein
VLGLLYDIHGNLPALERVLEDAQAEGVDRWLLGGDYGTPSPWPLETLDRLRTLEPRRGSAATVSAGCATRRSTGPR